jgi:hypothetical protein
MEKRDAGSNLGDELVKNEFISSLCGGDTPIVPGQSYSVYLIPKGPRTIA